MEQLVDGAFMEDPLLVDEATNGDHGKSSVHDFVFLVLFESGRFLSKAEGIESKVTRGALAFEGSLECVAANELEHTDEEQDLTHASGLDVEVVGVDGQHAREVRTAECELFLDKEAQCGEHADTAVLDFSLLQERDADVVGDEERVKLVRSRESFQVLGLEQERNRLGHLVGAHGDGRGGRRAGTHDIAGNQRVGSEAARGQWGGVNEAVHGNWWYGWTRGTKIGSEMHS